MKDEFEVDNSGCPEQSLLAVIKVGSKSGIMSNSRSYAYACAAAGGR